MTILDIDISFTSQFQYQSQPQTDQFEQENASREYLQQLEVMREAQRKRDYKRRVVSKNHST